MLLRKLLIISICCFNAAYGQLKIESATDFLTDDPSFDEQFMAQKRVLKIIATPSEKRTLQEIEPLDKRYFYNFDRRGRMVKKEIVFTNSIEMRAPKNTNYVYDDMGNLISEQTQEYNSYFTDYYEYDHLGRVKVKSTYREIGTTTENGSAIIEGRELVSKKNYSYQPVSNGVKRHYHNDYGRIYKYDLTTFNEEGLIETTQTKYIAAKNYAWKKYYYKNRLPYRIEQNENGTASELLIQYDSQNRLLKQDVYYGGTHKFTTDYIYNDAGLLTAQIRMDHASGYMLIYQYEYIYY